MLLVTSLSMGMVSCHDDDPDYDDVTPPTVQVAPSQISGLVTAMNGEGIKGATVKATADGKTISATTRADGSYTLENVAATTYAMEVTSEGKQANTGSVVIAKGGESAVYNAMLVNKGTEYEVSETEETPVEMKTEAIEEEAEVPVEAVIPAAAVADKDAKIIMTPVYTVNAAVQSRSVTTRAKESTMLMGIEVGCSKAGVNLDKPFDLSFELGEEVVTVVTAKKYADGKWTDVDTRKEGNKVIVNADEFGTYSVFADVNVQFKTSKEAVEFSESSFDNLRGSKDMTVSSVTYSYKQGGEIEGKATGKLNAQLRQILAHQIQGNKIVTATGTYPLNVTLPIGTGLNLSGSQELTAVTASCGNSSASGKVYGNVSIVATAYNRQHTGSSN